MIKIKTSDFKEFFKRSKSIKSSGIMPILSYIKLDASGDGVTLQKTNLKAYCIHQIDAEYNEYDSILLDEKLFTLLVNSTSAEYLEIKKEGKKIVIVHDGKTAAHPMEEAHFFPRFPDADGNKEVSVLSSEVLESIGVAKNFVESVELTSPLSFVHLYKNMVLSSDRNLVYWKKFDQLPDMVLDAETCSIISQFESLQHFRAGNYDFFDTGKTLYGFIQPTETTPDLSPVLDMAQKDVSFEIKKAYLLEFLEISVGVSSPNEIATATLKPKDNKLSLQLSENTKEIDNTMVFEVNGQVFCDYFNFDPRKALSYFKAIPYETISFSPFSKANHFMTIWSKEDQEFTGIITGLADIK